jgi:hypothetical protein
MSLRQCSFQASLGRCGREATTLFRFFGALVDLAGDSDFAAVGFDDNFDQAQAKTQAAL